LEYLGHSVNLYCIGLSERFSISGSMHVRAIILLSVFVVGCGQAEIQSEMPNRAASSEAAPALELALAQAPAAEALAKEAPAQDGAPSAEAIERKIIYTADVDLVVEDFTPITSQVDAMVKRHGGFIASSQVSGETGQSRSGHWKLRVPITRFDEFLQEAQGKLGEVRSLARNSQDVSEEYYDVEARIRNKRQEEARLLKLLAEQTGSLEDVLRVERELSRVREEIERLEGRLRVLADLTSLTTITLRIEEVRHYMPAVAATFGDRVRRSFSESVWNMGTAGESFVVAFVGAAPWLALLGVPVAIGVQVWRRRVRSSRRPGEIL
jgi:hypothetical protein